MDSAFTKAAVGDVASKSTAAPSASTVSALQTAGSVAQAAGVNQEVSSALGAAGQAAGLAQSASANIGGQAGEFFQAAQSQVSGVLSSIRPEPNYLAEHPLAGQAVSDFVGEMPAFAPEMARTDSPEAAVAAGLSQDNRLLRFYGPLTGDKKLFLESVKGTSEISKSFTYQLRLVSQNGNIDLKDMQGKNVTAAIQLQDNSEHPINGYVSRFSFTRSDGGLAYYDAELVPWLWYLKHRVNSRIYQDMSVLEVLDKVFAEGYGGMAKYEFRTSGTYRPESYIVQYDESDFNFVSRLMEAYGIFYYFEHEDSEHMLIVSDDSRNASFCPAQKHHAEVRFNGGRRVEPEDCVTHLAAERSFQPSKVSLNTFDFKAPSSSLYVETPSVAQQGEVPGLEVYHGNPAFAYRTARDGETDAQHRMEAHECLAKQFSGTSECRGLIAGHGIRLVGHYWFDPTQADDSEFVILSVRIEARNNLGAGTETDAYHNHFTAIRRKIPFRTQRIHPKPVMKGPQPATVVGPKGLEIHTDQYGRIKAQFPWDRDGRNDDHSSCWIRVSQPWAGKSWGTVAIPRIGQEVIIDFMEGDPDRPVCTGRLFNAEQPAPYGLPDAAHRMGFRSRSTPGGGGFCEMVIHDKLGQELINIHSQKDMATTVQNNQTTVINGPERTLAVTEGRYVATVKKEIQVESKTQHVYIKADTNITIALADDHFVTLDKKEGVIQLVVGDSAIILNKDGTITLDAKNIQSLAKEIHVVKGGKQIHLNSA